MKLTPKPAQKKPEDRPKLPIPTVAKGPQEWRVPHAEPRQRLIDTCHEYRLRVHHAVEDAMRPDGASVTNLDIIAEILRCCYTLIDARKDPDGSV